MQGETCPAGQQWIVRHLIQWRHALQGKCLASGVGTDGNAVGNGGGLQVVQAGVGFQVQVGVFRVGDQQTAVLQRPNDAAAEGVEPKR